MAGSKKYTVAQICAALDKTKGMVFLAAESLGCSPQTMHTYINTYPKIKAALKAHRGRLVDLAERSLEDKILDGEWVAIKYVLDRLAKDRGFGEEIKVDMTMHDEREQVREQLDELLTQTGDRLRNRGYTNGATNGSHPVTE